MKLNILATWLFCILNFFAASVFAESASMTLQSLRQMEGRFERSPSPILIGSARARNCRQVLATCDSCTKDKTILAWKMTYQIVAQQCEQEQQAKGCNQLVRNEPGLKDKMRDCSPQAVCERQDFVLNMEDTIKGCFWNAAQDFDMDIWHMITGAPGAVANAYKACYGKPKGWLANIWSTVKCESPIYYLAKMTSGVNIFSIYKKGKEFVQKSGVKMACYSPEAQTEMICYGILNVIAPTKVPNVKNVPAVVRMSGLAGREAKAAALAERARPRVAPPVRAPEARAPVARKPVKPKPAAVPRAVARSAGRAAPVVAPVVAPKVGAATAEATAAATRAAAERASFTEKFVNRNATNEAQNNRWVEFATAAENPPGTKFIDIENSAMKRLNDTTLDKNFVTALTNQHKQLLLEKMTALESKYPGVEFIPYSDFKSMRYALKPRPPATSLPTGLQRDISDAFKSANNEFARKLTQAKVLPAGENAAEWFRAGFGASADEASLASRYSRGVSGENQLRNFSDPDLVENLTVIKQTGELYRATLEKSLASTTLMEASTTAGKMIPRREVFDAVRKTTTDAQLQDFLKKTLGENVTLNQASNIRTYAELVDEFSPGIHVAKREVASLANSRVGGFTIDFAGLGSFNGQATADALARATDMQSIVRETRAGERAVTAGFNQRKLAVKTTIENVLKRNGISSEIIASGDDMVVRPNKPIPENVRAEIASELAENIDPSSIRMSHVGSDIPSGSERMIMATIGEACEKLIRSLASAAVSPGRLSKVLILVEVKGQTSAHFSFNMVLGEGEARLTPAERASLQSAAAKAQSVRCAK